MTKPAAAESRGGRAELKARIGRHRATREIVRSWRELVPDGGPTLVACSAGADSTALAAALRTATGKLVIGHVVHDLRAANEALADRDAARALAARLGLEFLEEQVRVGEGNKEAGARRLRYAALERMAFAAGASAVATAHHADDQLETVLMGLVRGAGPKGLRGVAPSRALGRRGVRLVRPMLGVTRAEARELCELAGFEWREDATNADTSRLRAALRAGVLPALEGLRPGAAKRASHAAALVRDAAAVLDDRVESVFGERFSWDRDVLRREPAAVIGGGLRRSAQRLLDGRKADRLGERLVGAVVRAVRDEERKPRTFEWPGGVRVRVTSRVVSVERPG